MNVKKIINLCFIISLTACDDKNNSDLNPYCENDLDVVIEVSDNTYWAEYCDMLEHDRYIPIHCRFYLSDPLFHNEDFLRVECEWRCKDDLSYESKQFLYLEENQTTVVMRNGCYYE